MPEESRKLGAGPMKDESGIWLKVPRDTFFLGLVRSFVGDLAKRCGFDSKRSAMIEMAVDEACSNVIRHGADDGVAISEQSHEMNLRIDIRPDRISVTLIDNGRRFPFEEYRKENLENALDKMQVGGLGIYLIKNFMDEVIYFHEPGVGNVLTMVNYMAAPPSEVAPPPDEPQIDPMEP